MPYKNIPKEIKRHHVLKAMAIVDRDSVPSYRKSYKYDVVHNGVSYPPKYVISLANLYVNGCELPPNQGGRVYFDTYDAQKYLRELGFKIVARG